MKDENKPFNDVIDHFNKIEGNAANRSNTELKKLPKPLKYFGFFIIGLFSISIVLMIILNLLN
ncbi:amino acid transporter [Neobacillus niacini]|uniref:amino acid transporter n=1 Tax=Neobacillus niacini TaxID=86668 RepID=UPI0030004A5A